MKFKFQFSMVLWFICCTSEVKAQAILSNPNVRLESHGYNYRLTGRRSGSVWTEEVRPIGVPSTSLLRRFKSQFPSWKFFSNPYTDEAFFFNVETNEPCYPGTRGQPANPCVAGRENVGSTFEVSYNQRSSTAPDPLTGYTHWVQWIDDNHPINGMHGDREETVDTSSATPFYYGEKSLSWNAQSPYYFSDQPSRIDSEQDHYWRAKLFIAQQYEGTKTVEIFDGIAWGWENKVLREITPPRDLMASLTDPSPPTAPSKRYTCPSYNSVTSTCYGGWSYNKTNLVGTGTLDFDPASTVNLPNSADPEPVPTPAILPSLIATGIYHGKKWRKRKKQQTDRTAA
jgi:hypothetical protein